MMNHSTTLPLPSLRWMTAGVALLVAATWFGAPADGQSTPEPTQAPEQLAQSADESEAPSEDTMTQTPTVISYECDRPCEGDGDESGGTCDGQGMGHGGGGGGGGHGMGHGGGGGGGGHGMGHGGGHGAGGGHGMGHGGGGGAGPMPAEFRDDIHFLLEHGAEITREVVETESGVETVTTSSNPEVAEVIRRHVADMEARLSSGGRVRGWDPLFAEMAANYEHMHLEYEEVEGGLAVTHEGDTPHFAAFVRAHAEVVNRFVAGGYDEAHMCHRIEE